MVRRKQQLLGNNRNSTKFGIRIDDPGAWLGRDDIEWFSLKEAIMYRKELYYLATLVLVFAAAGRVFALDPLQQGTGPDGIVSVEAENFDENVANPPHTWDLITEAASGFSPTGGFSGDAAMQSTPTTPAGGAVWVSGTASINADGVTTHIDDGPGQIGATVEAVRAVLAQMQAEEKDLVQVIAYCKTTDIEKDFEATRKALNWPWITVICDVCRPDLLFEIEATAMPR